MPLVALLVATAYWPGFAEAGNTGRWIVLSLAIPFLAHRCRPQWQFVAFIAWGALSLLWAASYLDGMDRLWRLTLLMLTAGIAATMSPREFRWTIWLASVGVIVSGLLAIGQFLWFEKLIDWSPVLLGSDRPDRDWLGLPQASPPAGLFVNRNYLGESAAVLIACLIGLRTWWLAGLLLPAWIVPGAKGALGALLLAAGWAGRRDRRVVALVVLAAAGGALWQALGTWEGSSLQVRIPLWANSFAMWLDNPLGLGLGSYWTMYGLWHDAVMPTHPLIYGLAVRPQLAHFDFVTLLAETGPGAFLLALLAWRGFRRSSREHEDEAAKYGLLAFLLCGLTGFPLYTPLTGFLAAVCVGFLCRDRGGLRDPDRAW